MKDNIDNIIREKYKQIQVPRIDLDKFQIRTRYMGYRVAIAILLLVISVIGIKTMTVKDDDSTNKDIVLPQNIVAENDIKLPVATETIKVGLDMASIAFLDVDYVVIIRVNRILGYTNYSSIQKKYMWPITKLDVTIERSLKGELKGNIQINKSGGIISIADWEKALSQEQIVRYGYNKLSKEEKENTYMHIVTSIDYGKIEEGKTYLVFLNEDKERYGGLMVAAGYMEEYDEKTDSTKYGNGWLPVKENVLIKQALEQE